MTDLFPLNIHIITSPRSKENYTDLKLPKEVNAQSIHVFSVAVFVHETCEHWEILPYLFLDGTMRGRDDNIVTSEDNNSQTRSSLCGPEREQGENLPLDIFHISSI